MKGRGKSKVFLRSLFLTYYLVSWLNYSLAQDQATFDQIELCLEKSSSKEKANPFFVKAKLCFFKKDYDSTLIFTYKFLKTANSNSELHDYCQLFRGFSFIKKSLYKEARSSLLKIPRSSDVYALSILNLGVIELVESNFERSLEYYDEIVRRKYIDKFKFNKGVVYHNIGINYVHLEEYASAEEHLFIALKHQESEKDTARMIGTYMDIANMYYEQYKDDLAIPFFVKGYELSKQTNDFELKQNAALNMSILEEQLKHFDRALKYRDEYDRWKDSLNNQQKVWDIAQLEKRFITERSKEKIEVLKLESKTRSAQRNGFIYSSGFLLILLLTSIYFYRQKLKTNRIIASQKRELEEISATKDQLFSIISHDLRSSVNAFRQNSEELSITISSKNRERIENQLSKNKELADSTYSLLDNLLNWALLQTNRILFIPESVSLAHLCDQVAYNFSAMMSEKKITFSNALTPNSFAFVDQESIKIVLRNLLDNAIKFTPENGKITISEINSTHNGFTFCIEDSGKGISQELIKKMDSSTSVILDRSSLNTSGSGLGLQLCKSMIQKNRGILLIESEEGNGTRIKISLPKSA